MAFVVGEFPPILTPILFEQNPLAMLHVVHELPHIPLPVLVEVLPTPVLLILEPVPDVEFPPDVIIFPFAVLHAFVELALVPFSVLVDQGASALYFSIE